jgi:hypothetical protein
MLASLAFYWILRQVRSAVRLPQTFLEEAVVYFTVTCDGVPIGATELDGWGIRAGPFAPLPSYRAFGLSRPACRLGIALLAMRWSRVPTAVAARAWDAASAEMDALEERLGLLDTAGAAVPSPRLAVVELPRRSRLAGTCVVADLGEAGSARGALRPSRPSGSSDASRPAA